MCGPVDSLGGLAAQHSILLVKEQLLSALAVLGRKNAGLEEAEGAYERSEEKLQQNNQLMRNILDNTLSVIVVRDLDGRRLLVNKQFETITKISRARAIGATPHNVHTTDVAAKILKDDRKVLESGLPLITEEYSTINNEHHTFISIRVPLYDSDDVPFAVCAQAIDITARKQAEQELKKHQGNLEEIVKQRTAELRAALMEKETLLAEIKTLSGIIPICAHCKKIRDDAGFWQQVESYVQTHSEAKFSHGICPACLKELYPNYNDEK